MPIVLVEVSRILDKSQKPSRTVDPNLEAVLLRGAPFGRKASKKGDPKERNLNFVSFFTTGMKKLIIFCVFSIGITQKERLLIGQPPSLDRPFSKAFATYSKSLKPRQVVSAKSTYPKLQAPVLSERIEITCQIVTLHFYHGVVINYRYLF